MPDPKPQTVIPVPEIARARPFAPAPPVLARPPKGTPAPGVRQSSPAIVAVVDALPPYVPAPNVGDPAEYDATIPVERMDFTELVDLYEPIVRDRGGRVRVTTPALPVVTFGNVDPVPEPRQNVLGTVLRFWPMIAIAAIVLVFLGGYLAFDDSGTRNVTQPGRAPTPVEKAPGVPG